MNLESLKEQLLERWLAIWDRICDSDTFAQLRERYQSLSPNMQKLAQWGGVLVVALFLLMIPMAFLSSSSESVQSFENNVSLLRDLYRVQRELASTPMVPDPPSASEMSSQVQSLLTQTGLAAEQISPPREISPERDAANALHPAGIVERGIEVTLLKLNLKQVSEIGAKLSQLGQGMHLTALDLKANAQNDHYFDVIFRVTGFTMPGAPADGSQENSAPPSKGKPPTLPSPPTTSPSRKGV